jgi:hypothetical protein
MYAINRIKSEGRNGSFYGWKHGMDGKWCKYIWMGMRALGLGSSMIPPPPLTMDEKKLYFLLFRFDWFLA